MPCLFASSPTASSHFPSCPTQAYLLPGRAFSSARFRVILHHLLLPPVPVLQIPFRPSVLPLAYFLPPCRFIPCCPDLFIPSPPPFSPSSSPPLLNFADLMIRFTVVPGFLRCCISLPLLVYPVLSSSLLILRAYACAFVVATLHAISPSPDPSPAAGAYWVRSQSSPSPQKMQATSANLFWKECQCFQ